MDVKFSDVFKRPLTRDELSQLHKSDLVELVSVLQVRESLIMIALQGAIGLAEKFAEMSLAMSKRLLKTLDVFFAGSLKSAKTRKRKQPGEKKKPINGKQLPSIAYPNLPVFENEIRADHPPQCGCGAHMVDSGMRETSERVECRPKVYFIVRDQRVTYTCKKCHVGIETAPAAPHIIPGSCYGDSFVKDVVLSKLCDLIPITRYTAIAARQGVHGIPANSLYDFSRHLAIFLTPSHARLMAEIMAEPVLGADETRHRMLEGSKKKNWYLWTFNSPKGIVYLCMDSRAGEVASDFLKNCACEFLVTDAYRGYATAISAVNKSRSDASSSHKLIRPAFCNAHARNNFCASSIKDTRQARYILWIYRIVFAHYPAFLKADGEELEKTRAQLNRAFELMQRIALREMPNLSKNSALYDAFNYFCTYYRALRLFIDDRSVPMHNMRSEQALRNPVIGRKTWYGTHSPDTARDLAKIMSLVESCKFLKANPREYIDDAVERVHKGLPAISPYEYKLAKDANSS